LSSSKKDFYAWLVEKKEYADKDAKKTVSAIVMLKEYASRHSLGDGVLLDGSMSQLESFIYIFQNNDFLKNSDSRRNGRLFQSLLLLKEFKSSPSFSTNNQDACKKGTPQDSPSHIEVPKGRIGNSSPTISVAPVSKNRPKTPEEKLVRRIEREFKKCKYIGDIQISDEEYEILRSFFRYGYKKICDSSSRESVNPLLAVALVQIGIRFYNGKFWIYVQKELGLDKLPQHHQAWIGNSFYKTLIHYGKYHVDAHEFMNNILLHCFITKYYADDLFDFLFAYYQIDLDRDLARNNSEMRKYLMQSMSKGETSARAYKIKRHTADAVSANEKGCKIRVGKILRFMDNALFNDIYPTTSQNRIAQLFCSWAASSRKFDIEKKHVSGLTNKGVKRYSMPYLHFDGMSKRFVVILPPQYIHLDDEEALPEIAWKITISERTYNTDTSVDSCVTGCKTERISDFSIDASMLMHEMRLELWKNGVERIQRFKIKSDSVRFFDDDWDAIDSATYTNYLPIGQAYAFVEDNSVIVSNSDSIVNCEKVLGYELYTLELQKGDVLRLPDGKAKSVGKPLEEGILSQSLISGAYAIHEDVKYSIYNQIPSVYFRMNPAQENGILLLVNNRKYRFDIEKCVRFDLDEQTEEKGYILKLDEYLVEDGIYNLRIDVPNSRKDRSFNMALIRNFEFRFNANTYIFEENGYITFNDGFSLESRDQFLTRSGNRFDFKISPVKDHLSFVFNSDEKAIDIKIYLPALKWKFDDGEWNVLHPEEIWHKDFPSTIWIKHPDDQITFSMTPIILDDTDDDNEEESFAVSFVKNKQEHIFQCDTRKMQSWFGYEENQRTLFIEINEVKIPFINIILKNYIKSCRITRNSYERVDSLELSYIGNDSCVVDIFQDGKKIFDKQNISTHTTLTAPSFAGNRKYKIVLFRVEDDDFGIESNEYEKCDEKEYLFNNLGELSKKRLRITAVTINNSQNTLEGLYVVQNLEKLDTNKYHGVLAEQRLNYRLKPIGNVFVDFITKEIVKLSFSDNHADFYYGKMTYALYSMTPQMLAYSANPFSYVNLRNAFYNVIIENSQQISNVLTMDLSNISKKYNYPLKKTNISKSVLRKLEKSKIYTTDQIVDYGLDRLCTIPKITPVEALDILSLLEEYSYKIANLEVLERHYRKDS